jgi:hypothetical protein
MIALLLAAQLAACPPSIRCTVPMLQTPTMEQAHGSNLPAKWFTVGLITEVVVFDVVTTLQHAQTLSQFSQDESARHPAVRWSIVAGCALAALHLAWKGPLW